MNLITPGELLETFRGAESLAIVGNAPTVRDHEHGELIDSHDIVVRFNRIQTEGLEDKIGRRTDILCVNAANSLAKAPPPAETSRPQAMVCFVSPQGCRQVDFAAFQQWVGDIPILLTFGPDMIGLTGATRSRPLTSGTYILFTLLRLLEIKRLFATGFTMFGAVPGGAGKVYEGQTSGVGSFHDIDQESALFAETLSQFSGELVLTPEVKSLVERFGTNRNLRPKTLGWHKRAGVRQWLARGISWRLLRLAMSLRRFEEAR